MLLLVAPFQPPLVAFQYDQYSMMILVFKLCMCQNACGRGIVVSYFVDSQKMCYHW